MTALHSLSTRVLEYSSLHTLFRGRNSQSEGWQDWGHGSQESQTQRLPPSLYKGQNQTPNSAGEWQMGGCSRQAEGTLQLPFSPGGPMGSHIFARDVRLGMHTILSVLRDLPEQLRNISLDAVSGQDITISKRMQELVDPLCSEVKTLKDLLENTLTEITNSTKSNERHLLDAVEKRDVKITDLEEKLRMQEAKSQKADRKVLVDHLVRIKTDLCRDVKKVLANIREMHRLQKETREIADASKIVLSSLDAHRSELRSKLELLCEFPTQVAVVVTAAEEQKVIQEDTTQKIAQVREVVEQMGSHMESFRATVSKEIVKAVQEAVSGLPFARDLMRTSMISPIQRSVLARHRPLFMNKQGRVEVSPIAEVRPHVKPSKESKAGEGPDTGAVHAGPSVPPPPLQKQNHQHDQQQHVQENQRVNQCQNEEEHQHQLQQNCQKVCQNQQQDQRCYENQHLTQHLVQNGQLFSQVKESSHQKEEQQLNHWYKMINFEEKQHFECQEEREMPRLPEAVGVRDLQTNEEGKGKLNSKQFGFASGCVLGKNMN